MMGESVLSHKKGEKYKAAVQRNKLQLNSFFNLSTSFVKDANPPAKDNQSTSVKDIEQMTVPAPPAVEAQPRWSMLTYASNDVLKAEIIWTLHTIAAHTSSKSSEEVGKFLQAMFPDSAIAEKFTCGEKKTSDMCVFG